MAAHRETTMDNDVVEERMNVVQPHAIVRVESDVQSLPRRLPHSEIGLSANDPVITHEWNALIAIQNRLSANERAALFGCGCTSPEVLLSGMMIFWVVVAFYEGIRDYEVKHFEAIVVYMLAFFVFAALVAGQLRFFIVAGVMCVGELAWNAAVLVVLANVRLEQPRWSGETGNETVPKISIRLQKNLPDFHDYVLRMIDEDFYGYAFVYTMKLIFILIVLANMFQVRHIQKLEAELRTRRRRIGYMMGDLRTHRDAGSPSFAFEALTQHAFTPLQSATASLRVSSLTLTTCTAGHSESSLPPYDSVSLHTAVGSPPLPAARV